MASAGQRITLVAGEALGLFQGGGIGTATTFLSFALAHAGHEVEILYLGSSPEEGIAPYWAGLYERHGVRVRFLDERERVRPPDMETGRAVVLALRKRRPDVVVAQDWQGPAAQAIRLRRLGLDFQETRFVVYCHGSTAWLTETSGKVRQSATPAALELAERASLALADIVVSPSAFMLDWLRARGWQLAERATVIAYFTRSAALGEMSERRGTTSDPERVRRIAFFGRLGEAKGIDVFLEGLALIEPSLLAGVELLFLGSETKSWPAERIERVLAAGAGQYVARILVEAKLDQQEALALLREPGTLAVMPSQGENSPYVVYECLELDVPFLAGRKGGATELIAEDDRGEALIDSTPSGVAGALTHVLAGGARRWRSLYDPTAVTDAWLRLLEQPTSPVGMHAPLSPQPITAVVVSRSSDDALRRCVDALMGQAGSIRVDVLVVETRAGGRGTTVAGARLVEARGATIAAARATGLAAIQSDWVILLDADDEPLPELVERLAAAQVASGADAVTCGIRLRDSYSTAWLFDGEPAGLGVVANRFGTVGLLRHELAVQALAEPDHADDDPDWTLYAALSLRGAAIVSIPEPLVERRTPPGDVRSAPAAAARVIATHERTLPAQQRWLARLAAAAATTDDGYRPAHTPTFPERVRFVFVREGVGGVLRRAVRRRRA